MTPRDRSDPVKVLDSVKLPDSPPAPEEPSGWAAADVHRAVSLKLVPQKLQDKYGRAATRAEFCALAVALYETEVGREITGRQSFTDSSDINVEKAASIGVVNGTGPGIFDPGGQLTREQAAVMLSRLAGAIGKSLPDEAPAFNDVGGISSWAVDSIGQVQAAGIMNGTGNNEFTPQGLYSREQCIVTILRLYDYLN